MQAENYRLFTEEMQDRELYNLVEFFKMLGNPTRIYILLLLMERESTVGSLAERLEMTQSAVSHQLSLLKSNRLVRRRRDGKMIFYTLSDDYVRLVMKKGMEHIFGLS